MYQAEPTPTDAGDMPMDGNVLPFPGMMSPEDMEREKRASDLRRRVVMLVRLAQEENVASVLEPDELSKIGSKVVREYDIDEASRRDWKTTAERAMAMARQKKEAKSHPWDGASNVKYPLLTTAALQFAARAYPAIVDGPRIVKCAVMGRDPQNLKAGAADRVSQHMSYQLLYEMDGWESDMDTALHQILIIGCAFKKVYEDPSSAAGACSELVSAFDLVVNQKTKTLGNVPRATHVFTLYPHEIDERVRAGKFIECDYKGAGEDTDDEDGPHKFYEQHRYLDIDGDGMLEPWIVTVHAKMQKVVRIKPGFEIDAIQIDMQRGEIVKIPRKSYFVKIPFIPDPEGGFYDIGFGKLLEALSDVIDTTLNQMMDAATLQNAGGGFMAAGVNLGKGKITVQPGVYKTVPATGDDIRKAMVNIDHPGPSAVLFNLLNLMIEAGKDIAAVKDVLTGETPTNQTATSTMAAIEQGLKVFTAIYKRIFRALKEEFKLLFEINRLTLQAPKYLALLDEPIEVAQADYMGELDVMPVADPNMVTDMQRMAKAQLLLEQVKAGNPHINPFEATKRALEAARIERVEDVLVPPQQNDPMQELQVEGAMAEVDKIKADTVKTVADTAVSLASIALPVNTPLQVSEPMFMPAAEPMIGAPLPMDDMSMVPEAMAGGAAPFPDDPDAMAMLGGAMPPQPEAAPVPPGMPM